MPDIFRKFDVHRVRFQYLHFFGGKITSRLIVVDVEHVVLVREFLLEFLGAAVANESS